MPLTGAIDLAGAALGLGVGLGFGVAVAVVFLYPAGQTGFAPETFRTLLPFTHVMVDACAGVATSENKRAKESAETLNPDKFFNLRTLEF